MSYDFYSQIHLEGTNIMNIYDLSEYQVYKLKSIDPALGSNWREVIQEILPQLNKESQASIYKNILAPRGINYNLVYKRPDTLKSVMRKMTTQNKELTNITIHMSKLIDSTPVSYQALKLADEIEAMLDYLDGLDVQGSLYDQKNRINIKTAFLYDLADWIDKVELIIDGGLRSLNNDIVKTYLKEVFIKQKIQGRDFRSWDSTDLSFQELTHLPSLIKKEGKQRKFFVVEGQNYWFIVGIASQPNNNAYSFRRFLYESSSGEGINKFIYLTHLVIEKNSLNNNEYINHISYCMSRLYTLDRGVSDTVLKFVLEVQHLNRTYLTTLLKKPLDQDGSSSETIIANRMVDYEKQLSILILNKLPNVIQTVISDKNDQNFLFYHLDQLIKRMIENTQDFRLQPLAMYSESSEIMVIKLISLRKLLDNLWGLFTIGQNNISDYETTMENSLLIIKEKLKECEANLQEINSLKEELNHYLKVKQEGSFWQKMKLGKSLRYTAEEIIEIESTLNQDLFMFIIRLAKNKAVSIVYPEFECEIIVNESYRHYAIADGKIGITRLPRILRLPENKSKFTFSSVEEMMNNDIFKPSQPFKG